MIHQLWSCTKILSGYLSHFYDRVWLRHGVNSVAELELMVNSNSTIGIGSYYLKTKGIGIEKFWIGIEVSYKKYNPEINLPFNFLIQKYFLHDNTTRNIN